jgi:hypothetical protein
MLDHQRSSNDLKSTNVTFLSDIITIPSLHLEPKIYVNVGSYSVRSLSIFLDCEGVNPQLYTF